MVVLITMGGTEAIVAGKLAALNEVCVWFTTKCTCWRLLHTEHGCDDKRVLINLVCPGEPLIVVFRLVIAQAF